MEGTSQNAYELWQLNNESVHRLPSSHIGKVLEYRPLIPSEQTPFVSSSYFPLFGDAVMSRARIFEWHKPFSEAQERTFRSTKY